MLFIQSAPVCTSRVILEDLDTGTSLGNTDVTISDNNVTFTTKVNRHYSITVRAVNSRGSTNFMIELSKDYNYAHTIAYSSIFSHGSLTT